MKLIAILLFVALSEVQATSYGQNISIHEKNITIEELLLKIENQTTYHFIYDSKLDFLKTRSVPINATNASISSILDKCLKGLPVSYTIIQQTIALKSNDGINTLVQALKVTGHATDAKGYPLAGVSVRLKGSQSGTVTDVSGNYSLSIPDSEGTLVFSYIGYETQEIKVNSSPIINVSLKTGDNKLNEVVVLAYGSQRNQDITGAVQTLNTEQLQDQPAAQITQKLQGQLAGVQITETSGNLGGGMVVRIRGAASISAGNSPLYVVDGMPIIGDLSNINPDEIETISVLKDAASTSLYGSRAANGVVLVTTKKGKAGATTVSLNTYFGYQQVPQKGRPDMMNAQEFAQFEKEVEQDNNQPVNPLFQNPSQYGQGTNWFDAIIHTAPMQNYSLSINSNKDKLSTSVILGYLNQDGVIIDSKFERYSVRANVEYKANKYVKFGANIAPSYQYTNQATTDGSTFGGGAPIIEGAILTSPLAPYKNPDGTIPINTSGYGSLDGPNVYNELKTIKNDSKGTHILGNAFAEVYPIDGLTIRSSINVDYSTLLYNNFTPASAGGFFNPGNNSDATRIHASVQNTMNYSWLWENTVDYKRSFGKNNFDILGGYTAQYYRVESSSVNASNFPDDLVQTINAASTFSGSGDVEENTLLSYLARANYNYDEKYLLTASIRTDGSSRFGSDQRYGTFPSFSAGWIVSKENFMQKLPVISNLKLRASYGSVGNNNIGNYTQYATVVGTNYPFNDVLSNGRSIAGLNNVDLGWEKSKEADFGLDISVLNNRISFSYDYYNKVTSNLLYSVDIPISSGFFNYITNIGKIKFWGNEFNVSSKNMVGAFKWNTNFNISFNRNVVQQLGTSNAAIYGDGSITEVGKPIGQLYGFVFQGIYNNQAEFDASPKYAGAQVGTAKFKDVNGDGVVNFDNTDRAILGDPSPKFEYGITNNFSYKNFDLSIVLSGEYGNKMANRIEQFSENLDGAFNVTKDVANRWRSPSDPGDGRYGKDLAGTTSYQRDNFSSMSVYSASFLTVKNISFGYTIPFKNNNYFHSIRVFASGQQLWVFTKYPGANPEASNTSGGGAANVLGLGNDWSSYPVPRTITIGANVNF